MGKVTIVQRKGEYEPEFLKGFVAAIAKVVLGAHASRLNIRVEFAGIRGAPADETGSTASMWSPSAHKTDYTIKVSPKSSLFAQAETIAHELTHVLQYATDRLYLGRNEKDEFGSFWRAVEGGPQTFVPEATPYNDRPWEKEAFAGGQLGGKVYDEFQTKKLIPKPNSSKGALCMGDLPDNLSREELLAIIAAERQKMQHA